MSQHLSEQEIIRRDKLKELEVAGIDAYPAPLFSVSHYSKDIKEAFSEETKDAFASVCIAGRVMSINDKGRVFFIKTIGTWLYMNLYILLIRWTEHLMAFLKYYWKENMFPAGVNYWRRLCWRSGRDALILTHMVQQAQWNALL